MAPFRSLLWLPRYLILSAICHNKIILEVTDAEQKDAIYQWLKRNKSNYLCVEQTWQADSKKERESDHRVMTVWFARRKNAVSFQMTFKGDVNILYERFPGKRSENV